MMLMIASTTAGPETLYRSLRDGRYEFLGRRVERELAPSGVLSHQLANGQIKRRSQVVDSVSDDQSGILRDLFVNTKRDMKPIALVIGPKSVEVRLEVGVEQTVQIKDMFVDPFDL